MSNSDTKHFDLEELRSNLEDDETFVIRYLGLLKNELDTSLLVLKEKFEKQDRDGVSSTAHRIKGTALNSCCGELSVLALTLEKTKEFDKEVMGQLIQKIESEIALIKTLI
ncbi:MAG TPA: Hpt domain-containing protein [Leptospiraceae bacterium]|nr:Hpt domain-containing protein [Leptospiraceae bacterium]HRG74305.1 Hpt domain-containing protein [Leptospiraceae bacterium]